MEPTPPGHGQELLDRSQAFGRRLKLAREASGNTVQGLAHSTRISQAFLEALEEGAFERLPGQVFGRGFVRSICKAVGASPDELCEDFDACWQRPTRVKPVLQVEIKEKPFQSGRLVTVASGAARYLRPGRSFGWFMAFAVVIAGGAVLGVRAYRGSKPASPQSSAKPVESAQAQEQQPQGLQAQEPQPHEPQPAESAAAEKPVSEAAAVAPAEPPTADPAAISQAPEPVAAPPPAAADEHAPASVSVASEGTGDQVLEIVATDPVRVRADVDGAPSVSKEYPRGTYRILFHDKVDLMVYDAAAVKLSFNGRPIGSLGAKGRVRRLSFQAAPPMQEGKKL